MFKARISWKGNDTNIHTVDHSLTLNPLYILYPTPQYIVMFPTKSISGPELFL